LIPTTHESPFGLLPGNSSVHGHLVPERELRQAVLPSGSSRHLAEVSALVVSLGCTFDSSTDRLAWTMLYGFIMRNPPGTLSSSGYSCYDSSGLHGATRSSTSLNLLDTRNSLRHCSYRSIAGLDWALEQKCVIISMSLGAEVKTGEAYREPAGEEWRE